MVNGLLSYLFSAVLVRRSQFYTLPAVSFTLFVVGFFGISVVALAVAETSYGAGEPFL